LKDWSWAKENEPRESVRRSVNHLSMGDPRRV
jgi:hypothetical protein